MRASSFFPHLAVVLLSGCGASKESGYTSTYAPASQASDEKKREGSDVILAQESPTSPTCKSLGPAVGQAGNAFYGGFVASDTLITMALEDLQKKTSKMGGNYVRYDSPTLGASGEGQTTSASVTGLAYSCPDGATEGTKPEPAPAASTVTYATLEEVPQGVAGFRFVMTEEEAAKACTDAGHTWRRKDDVSLCTGTAKHVGFDATVQLKHCGAEFCQILAIADLEEEPLKKEITALKSALVKAYGEPEESKSELPSPCQNKLIECVMKRQAYFTYAWEFAGGETITLKLGKEREIGSQPDEVDKKIRLRYTRPEPSVEVERDL